MRLSADTRRISCVHTSSLPLPLYSPKALEQRRLSRFTPSHLASWLLERGFWDTLFGQNGHIQLLKRAKEVVKFIAQHAQVRGVMRVYVRSS